MTIEVEPNDRIYQPGDQAVFCTHEADSELTPYDGQTVTIIRQLEFGKEVDPEVGLMWRVQAHDREIDAFADELDDKHHDYFVPDEGGAIPTCDLCHKPQLRVGDDWNGETGNHRSCEEPR